MIKKKAGKKKGEEWLDMSTTNAWEGERKSFKRRI